MKHLRTIICSTLLATMFAALPVQAQSLKYFTGLRQQSNGYHMFLGDDRDLMATTVKGFGSGLLDIADSRMSVDILQLGGNVFNITAGAGFAVNKYRFRDNLVFAKDLDGKVIAFTDPDPTHDYINTFFGYGKSKLVYGSVFFPVYLNLKTENVLISAGGFYDIYLSGKLKRKYKDDAGEPIIEKVPNKEFRDFNLNQGKVGFTFIIASTQAKYGIGVTYMMTPFFVEGQGPSVNELRIGIFQYTPFGD